MLMLSLFPELLFLAPLSAFLIRLAVSIAMGYLAYRHAIMPGAAFKILCIVEGVAAVLLIAGGYTQAAALVGLILVGVNLLTPARILPRSTLLLLGLMCLSLLMTGAGAFAFDLPL